MLESVQVGQSVSFITKDIASMIAPGNYVIQSAFEFDSRLAGH
jgi:hypothetical protein